MKRTKKSRTKKTTHRFTVLRTIESFYPRISGPANQAFRISKELELRSIKSPVFTSDYQAEGSPRKEFIDGVKVTRFDVKAGFMKYLATPRMKSGLKGFDIIHAHNHRSYQTAISYKAAKKAGKPFVIKTHGSLLGYDQYLKGISKLPYILYDAFGGKRMVLDADAVIVNSRKEYKDALDYGVQKERLHLIPSGIDVSDYSPIKRRKAKIEVLFVGRISRNRNLEPIIKAAAILKKTGRYTFSIVGGEVKSSDTSRAGYLDELKQMVRRMGVDDIVKFHGEKRGAELRNSYRTADIFVYTSKAENFGQTILEAGAAGLPIICTRVGIAPEIITDKKSGYLVRANAEDVADRIKCLSSAKRAALGKAIRKRVSKSFDWSSIIESYIKIYRDLA